MRNISPWYNKMSVDCLPSTTTLQSLGYRAGFDDSSSEEDVKFDEIDGLFDKMETQQPEPEIQGNRCEEETGTERPKRKQRSPAGTS